MRITLLTEGASPKSPHNEEFEARIELSVEFANPADPARGHSTS